MRQARAEIEVKGGHASVELDLDGEGKVELNTGSAFFDHMLHAFARMSGIDLKAKAEGEISYHRARALGLALGKAMDQALGDKAGIIRYGWAAVPMDESLAQVALDISGRSYLVIRGDFRGDKIGDLDAQQVKTILEAVVEEGRITLNAKFEGENDHHQVESLFKAMGLALREAKRVEGEKVPSTKGVL